MGLVDSLKRWDARYHSTGGSISSGFGAEVPEWFAVATFARVIFQNIQPSGHSAYKNMHKMLFVSLGKDIVGRELDSLP